MFCLTGKKDPTMPAPRISVRLESRLHERLAKLARAKGQSESELVREALTDWLDAQPRPESCYDIAKRTGMIGAAKYAPRDLSTNRKHFEGFGKR
jgi:Arc/MetJ-type ribon-helix-helix transcriptional regulator